MKVRVFVCFAFVHLKNIFFKLNNMMFGQVKKIIPERTESDHQLLEMDRDENKLDAFLHVHKNSLKGQYILYFYALVSTVFTKIGTVFK